MNVYSINNYRDTSTRTSQFYLKVSRTSFALQETSKILRRDKLLPASNPTYTQSYQTYPQFSGVPILRYTHLFIAHMK